MDGSTRQSRLSLPKYVCKVANLRKKCQRPPEGGSSYSDELFKWPKCRSFVMIDFFQGTKTHCLPAPGQPNFLMERSTNFCAMDVFNQRSRSYHYGPQCQWVITWTLSTDNLVWSTTISIYNMHIFISELVWWTAKAITILQNRPTHALISHNTWRDDQHVVKVMTMTFQTVKLLTQNLGSLFSCTSQNWRSHF